MSHPPVTGHSREFALIRRFLRDAPAAPAGVRVGPGDDCAVVAGDGIALSSDLSVEGVHFRRDWLSPREIGWRAAAAALSDLAAMAASPIGVLASVAVAPGDAGAFAAALMRGVRDAVESVGGVLLGGDLTRSPGPALIDVVVVGEAGSPILRSGAAAGEGVWVTGELGGAATFVRARLAGTRPGPGARARFARPRPRIAEAHWLAERGIPTAMIDLSDGLAADVAHLASASGVAVDLHSAAVPRHRAAMPGEALGGGEDYELCFTSAAVTSADRDAFRDAFGIALTRVGRVRAGRGVFVIENGGRRRAGAADFQHFPEG